MKFFVILLLSISFLAGEVWSKCRTYHRVKKGESLWIIAKKYGVYVSDLKRANPKLKNRKFIRPGERLCIPYKRRVAKKRTESYIIYTVKPGDSLIKIAKKFGVSWKEIKRINNLKSNVIRAGQKLKIPVKKKYAVKKRYKKKEKVIYVRYRVRRGDSLIKIAKKFGVSWKAIKRANNLKSDIIRVGQILKIPIPESKFKRRFVKKPNIKLSFLPVEGEFIKRPNGIDILAECGKGVRVIDNGIVVYSGDDLSPYGNMIIVDHKRYLSVYAYNMENLVEKGDRVTKGEIIAKVGLKPGSGRCALHFEIRAKDGSVLNPLDYIGKK